MEKISYHKKSLNKKSLNLKALSVKALTLLLLCVTNPSYAMTSKQNPSAQSQEKFATDLSEGRDFSVLSFNADGSELMFNECFETKLINKDAKENERECAIFRLNLNTKALKRYSFPDQDKFRYSNGSFSPKGNFITFVRTPKTDYSLPVEKYNELARQNSHKVEIGIINADGSNFKIIKTAEGLKGRPIMSNDETKIAYYRGTLRKPGSKTFAANFDIYEIDLKAKTDKLFAGPYEFFETGQMQYLKGDKEIFMHAYAPRKYAKTISDYTRRYNNSSIYTIVRGELEVPEPINFKGISDLQEPFVTNKGAMFFYGVDTKDGFILFKKAHEEILKKWKSGMEFSYKLQIISTPDEQKVFFTYTFNVNVGDALHRPDASKKGIAFLDTANSEWRKFDVPSVSSSLIISVDASKQIEIRPTAESKNSLKTLPNFTLTNPLNSK